MRLTPWPIVLLLAGSTCGLARGHEEPKAAPPATQPQEGEMAGYLLVSCERVPAEFNAGFSLYAAAWPLLEHYPGHRFQTGLFGTWMHAQYDGTPPKDCYSDIEGGLGWWRDTRFPTETPKFIMGGVGLNFHDIANGPAHGAGDWNDPRGLYGVAQLSSRLLFPIDGLSIKQGTKGDLFGYGYLPLPFTAAKATTAGANVPTGDQSWTLFLNTANFKGPVCFFTPYFWSRSAQLNPKFAGQFLDSRPSDPNKAFQMETQYVPAKIGKNAAGETFARVAPTRFPVGKDGTTVVLHRLTSYSKAALWDGVRAWFDGGQPVNGAINPAGSHLQHFKAQGGSTWEIYPDGVKDGGKVPMAWGSFATPITPDPTTYGYKWDASLVTRLDAPEGSLVMLPEYYRLGKDGGHDTWHPAKADQATEGTGLKDLRFTRPREELQPAYDTPYDAPADAPKSAANSWKSPGPAAGPFQIRLGDGSVVTYCWYRFADQPALLNADLTRDEREAMQLKAEMIHRAWAIDQDYLAPPTVGTLASLDPAQIVTPPKGLEVGYVPIATRHELATSGR